MDFSRGKDEKKGEGAFQGEGLFQGEGARGWFLQAGKYTRWGSGSVGGGSGGAEEGKDGKVKAGDREQDQNVP